MSSTERWEEKCKYCVSNRCNLQVEMLTVGTEAWVTLWGQDMQPQPEPWESPSPESPADAHSSPAAEHADWDASEGARADLCCPSCPSPPSRRHHQRCLPFRNSVNSYNRCLASLWSQPSPRHKDSVSLTSEFCLYKVQQASTGLWWDTFYGSDLQHCPVRGTSGPPMASGLMFAVKDSSHSLVLTKHPKCFQGNPRSFFVSNWLVFATLSEDWFAREIKGRIRIHSFLGFSGISCCGPNYSER